MKKTLKKSELYLKAPQRVIRPNEHGEQLNRTSAENSWRSSAPGGMERSELEECSDYEYLPEQRKSALPSFSLSYEAQGLTSTLLCSCRTARSIIPCNKGPALNGSLRPTNRYLLEI